MAFISFNQKELYKILNICNQVSKDKNAVEVFTYTKVKIIGEFVQFSAVNQDVFYQTKIKPVNVEEVDDKTSFLVKTDIFTGGVNLIKDEIIGLDIDIEKNILILQGSKSKHTLRINTDDVEDLVMPEQKEGETEAIVKIETAKLLNANKISNVAVGNARTVYQPEFLNICYTLIPTEKKIILASTDRYRVSKTILTAEFSSVSTKLENEKKNFLIQPKNLGLLEVFDNEENLELSFGSNFLWIKVEDSVIVMRYSEGDFPDYNKIIPQSFACSFSLNTKDLLEALKQVQFAAKISSNSQSMIIQLKPAEKKILLSAETDDGYASESELDIINYEGVEDNWKQSFNIEYLLSYINTIPTETFLWESNPGKPSVLSPKDAKDSTLYLVSGLK